MSDVTRDDRERAWFHAPPIYGPSDKANWMSGQYDKYCSIIEDFKRCREVEYAAGLAAGIAQERERCVNLLRSDAAQTEIEARRILGNLITLTPADTDDWAMLIAMKHAIADMLEKPSAVIAAAEGDGDANSN